MADIPTALLHRCSRAACRFVPLTGSFTIDDISRAVLEAAGFDPEKLTNAIWDKLTTIDTGPGEGDFMASYADLKKAVTEALGVKPEAPDCPYCNGRTVYTGTDMATGQEVEISCLHCNETGKQPA